jgi:hypothetical protein
MKFATANAKIERAGCPSLECCVLPFLKSTGKATKEVPWRNMDMLPAPCGTSYQQALDLSYADRS